MIIDDDGDEIHIEKYNLCVIYKPNFNLGLSFYFGLFVQLPRPPRFRIVLLFWIWIVILSEIHVYYIIKKI